MQISLKTTSGCYFFSPGFARFRLDYGSYYYGEEIKENPGSEI